MLTVHSRALAPLRSFGKSESKSLMKIWSWKSSATHRKQYPSPQGSSQVLPEADTRWKQSCPVQVYQGFIGGEIKDGGTQASILGKQAFESTQKHLWEARLEMR